MPKHIHRKDLDSVRLMLFVPIFWYISVTHLNSDKKNEIRNEIVGDEQTRALCVLQEKKYRGLTGVIEWDVSVLSKYHKTPDFEAFVMSPRNANRKSIQSMAWEISPAAAFRIFIGIFFFSPRAVNRSILDSQVLTAANVTSWITSCHLHLFHE